MEKKDRVKFGKIMAQVAIIYEREFPAYMMEVYFSLLSQYSLEQIEMALTSHLRDTEAGQYFPKPAHIIRQIEGNYDEQAQAAWALVRRAISDYGYWKSVQFADTTIMAAIDGMGGWQRLCEMESDDAGYRGAEFCRLYKHYKRHPEEYRNPVYLVGGIEANNRLGGYNEYTPEPVKIGVVERQAIEGEKDE